MQVRVLMTTIVVLMISLTSLSGCFGNDDKPEIEEISSPFSFEKSIPMTTWYHYAGGIDALNQSAVSAANITANLTENNTPFWSQGSYYSIGMTTFEPTMGITSADNLYMASYGNGPGGSTAVVQCSGLIEMVSLVDYACQNAYNPTIPIVNSNDPYIYVDPWTDRIMKFDMHALLGMTVEWSDNEGDSWKPSTIATSVYSVQDHQTIGSSPYEAALYETTWVYCINGNAPHPLCSTSFDGGWTWTPEVSGAPLDCQSGGLTAHIEGANNGNFYRGNIGCNGEGYSIYRSTNGGLTWTEHPLPTEVSGSADTWNGEEAQIGVDEDNNLHAMWMGLDNMPYYAYSRDNGDTWSEAMMIAPPAGLNGTGFPVVTAGDGGKVAFGYVGDGGGDSWNAYITILTDAFSENPLFTTVQVNLPEDPIDTTADCGYNRCGGLGDFLDMRVDQHGRPWFALAHNLGGEMGIFATFTDGPSLRGENLTALNSMPLGGPATL
ncbi:MAG TPA: exo-alpha-sialidase [Candidatus Poseidoniales archaeon]|jgi:hypothetical protein|nr:exo-alpha-sialidase [Candidatus Poseidoniales archaeon]HIK79069.1 exo-alpha-sialidase [Candidatus Poseidoniales archaeon]